MTVQTIYASPDVSSRPANQCTALLAGDTEGDCILPGLGSGEGWKDQIFLEMIRKCKARSQYKLAKSLFGKKAKRILKRLGIAAGVSGATAGVTIGTGVVLGALGGIVGGPPGMAAGAALGGGAGLAVVAVVGGISAADRYRSH